VAPARRADSWASSFCGAVKAMTGRWLVAELRRRAAMASQVFSSVVRDHEGDQRFFAFGGGHEIRRRGHGWTR